MIDIKQYLEQTNTVLLTKDAFEYLKERASVPDKVKAEYDPSADLISREETLTAFADYVGSGMSMNDFDALWDIVVKAPSVNPQERAGRCKDCKYFEYDSVAKVDGIPLIVAHEICSRWGDGCKTSEDGYCFLFEPQKGADR